MAIPQMSPATGHSPAIRLPIRGLALATLASPLVVGALACVVALALGRGLSAVMWATAVAYVGSGSGLAFITLFGPRPAMSWGTIIIGASSLRMAIAVVLAAAVSLGVNPNPGFFWVVLLAALILILIVETALARRALVASSPLPRPGTRTESE